MRLLFFVVVIIAIYIVVRRMSASHTMSTENYRPSQPAQDTAAVINAEDIDDPPHRSQYEITRYYFAKTDATSGPPDPEVFYDEFFVDLTNVETREKFSNSMFVCTPRGITEEMIKEKWDSVVGGELLIVRRYNIDAILAGAKRHLEEIYESALKITPGARANGRDYVG
jgi:hypothetical protein